MTPKKQCACQSHLTKEDLTTIVSCIDEAISWVRNEIATCPDVNVYYRQLESLDDEVEKYKELKDKVASLLEKVNGS